MTANEDYNNDIHIAYRPQAIRFEISPKVYVCLESLPRVKDDNM